MLTYASAVPKDDINWLFQLFTDNGFMMVSAVLGFVCPILFIVGLMRGWWYTGNYVRNQKEQLDVANAFMQASAAAKDGQQMELLKEIAEGQDKGFEASEKREEAIQNGINEIRIRQGGGTSV